MIIALEGPSYAGKTTVIRHLRHAPETREAAFFDCYVESIDHWEDIPRPATASASEQLSAFETFMTIEESRVQRLAGRTGLVLLDRSVDTLMAHAHALDEMYNFGLLGQIHERLAGMPHLRPNHTVYLDVSADKLALRRKKAGHKAVESDYFLHDPVFLALARDYFCGSVHASVSAEVTVIPGEGSRIETASAIHALVGLWAAQ